jgi:uncharacterized membrane protein YkvA (DUF1232 family)
MEIRVNHRGRGFARALMQRVEELLLQRARRLKLELFALYLAARDPRTPWYAKLVVAGFVAYAVTPVDLFPDALPILGIIDDLIFVPVYGRRWPPPA